ncbi:MAG TPA: phosphoribosylaminoimidazolesuccinocarboxamide synthase, partial [Thermoanaerobaculia bacterium]|nr:phosphoribosylaminoimidazolesuccinocarboxamide synthase [Thermoanaerobaculia bacterium]
AIPGKGKILNQLSNFWFELLRPVVANHLVATAVGDFPATLQPHAEILEGRAVLVRKLRVIPFECVARGYLAGSAFREYEASGTVCGEALPPGLARASRLAEPIFTPATKAESGHDENLSAAELRNRLGAETADKLEGLTLELYRRAAEYSSARGLLLADTKFEFGTDDEGRIVLIDEVLTPDSSRYWEAEAWRPGSEPLSFDKQYVRNWLDASGWDHDSPPPELPPEVVAETSAKYQHAFERLTGHAPRL